MPSRWSQLTDNQPAPEVRQLRLVVEAEDFEDGIGIGDGGILWPWGFPRFDWSLLVGILAAYLAPMVTLRRHLENVYRALDVTDRASAIARIRGW